MTHVCDRRHGPFERRGWRTSTKLGGKRLAADGPLVLGAVVLLATGRFAFVELDRGTMSYARLLAKLDRYAAYRTAPATGRGNAARVLRNDWQEHYAGHDLDRALPPLLVVFAPVPFRVASARREAEFLARAAGLQLVRHRRVVAVTTTLERLTACGPVAPVWRVAGGQGGYWMLDRLPAAR